MITKILIGVALVLIVLVVVIALQPADFRISRTATIFAPAEVVFADVNDVRQYNEWSPFSKMDPAMKVTYSGPPSGPGATLAWAGNNKAGEGRMTLVENRPNELVRYRLEFLKPFQATNIAEFTFKPEGDRTVVTWSMTGTKNFMCKAFGLVIDSDKMCGGMFEEGLANLNSMVAKQPQS